MAFHPLDECDYKPIIQILQKKIILNLWFTLSLLFTIYCYMSSEILQIQMSNKYRQILNKYIPKEQEDISKHNYSQDSFQAEEVSRKEPYPMINNQQAHNYQLTFKKDPKQQYFLTNQIQEHQKELFNEADASLLKLLNRPLAYFYGLSMEELSNFPFVDLMSLNSNEKQKIKLNVIGQILQVKRIRMKIGSSFINLKCLKQKQNINHEEKHKIYLLQLLWKQLNKKLFIQVLKLNVLQRRYENQQNFAQRQVHINENNLDKDQSLMQNTEKERSSLWNKGLDYGDEKSLINEQQLIIFYQLLNLILKKNMFYSFNKIDKYAKNKQNQYHVTKNIPKNTNIIAQPTNIILIPSDRSDRKQPYYSQQYSEDQQYDQNNNPEQQNSQYVRQQSKLNELYEYIEHLHEECAQTNNLKKKYFIKWKIYILEDIVQNIVSKLRNQEMVQNQNIEKNQNQDQQDFHLQSNEPIRVPQHHIMQQPYKQLTQRQRQLSYSKYSSLSQDEQTLKLQKRNLKQLLRSNQQREFLQLLKRNSQKRKIKGICKYIYQSTLQKKAFAGWAQSIQQQKMMKQMDDYYEEVACDQNQETYTSEIFHKTNLFYKYFNYFKQNWKYSKIQKQLFYVTVKISFLKIKYHSQEQKKYDQLIKKRRINYQKQLIFRYFKIWKQRHESQNAYSNEVKMFVHKKQVQIKQDCFILLKINFKKNRIRQLKITNQYYGKLKNKIFNDWKQIYQDNLHMRYRQEMLVNYLYIQRGEIVINRLKEYYSKYIEFQRFTIKEEKFKRQLIRLHALRRIKNWRKHHLRKQAYQMIQTKLIQMKAKQKKRQIFKLWLYKLSTIQNFELRSNKSQNHKDWLVKYYGKLCSVYEH